MTAVIPADQLNSACVFQILLNKRDVCDGSRGGKMSPGCPQLNTCIYKRTHLLHKLFKTPSSRRTLQYNMIHTTTTSTTSQDVQKVFFSMWTQSWFCACGKFYAAFWSNGKQCLKKQYNTEEIYQSSEITHVRFLHHRAKTRLDSSCTRDKNMQIEIILSREI